MRQLLAWIALWAIGTLLVAFVAVQVTDAAWHLEHEEATRSVFFALLGIVLVAGAGLLVVVDQHVRSLVADRAE